MRTFLSRLLLAIALVLAQTGVSVHAIGHLEDAQRTQDGKTQKTHACEACVAYAAADVPETPSQPFLFPEAAAAFAAAREPAPACIGTLAKPFQSQAPPAAS
jgi:hypothetical protein